MLSARTDKPWMYEAANICIYCGKGAPAKLTKEHIVPQGLGGGYILPKSSCEECRIITHAFETTVMSKNLIHFRTRARIHTRNPKKRPTHLPLATSLTGPARPIP